MNDGLLFRVEDLLGLDERCDHLSSAELEELVEGRLPADRFRELKIHADGCPACTELLDDLAQYRTLVLSGLTIPSERAAFEKADADARARLGLRRTPRRWFRGLFSGLTPVWLTPALATLILMAVWLWPVQPRLIATVEPVPLQPPPTVRGLSLGQTWERLEGPWSADDMREAARILDPAVREHPERADLLFYLGVARLRSGDPEGALEALRRADEIETAAPSENTRWMLAAALERVGRTDEACDALRSVVEIGGTRAEAAREITDGACKRP
jgi:tetratricopeptide (TPR) repeat protein